jgi:hypothetical protein
MRELTREEDLVLQVLVKHIGEVNAVDMGELYREVFEKDYGNKINDTRPIRHVITALRYEGMPIAHCSRGYYMAYGTEFLAWKDRVKHQALKKLKMIAPMESLTLKELLGQMALNLEEGGGNAEN